MKKNVLIKGILLLILLALLTVGFAGCTGGIITSTTGTVYLVLSGPYLYDLYTDDYRYFDNVSRGTYTITNIPTGNHLFEAVHYLYLDWGYDRAYQYIHSVANYVYLYP